MKCLKTILIGTFIIGTLGLAQAQSKQDSIYEANLTKEYIRGMYIPANMKEAFRELINLSSESSLDKFKEGEEELVARRLHFGLGKWISAKWNFYGGSRFTKYLNELGVSYPDDMVTYTIVSFHRFINQRPLELEERAAVYREKREAEFQEKLKNAETISKRKVKKN
jgi:hypothetical protein